MKLTKLQLEQIIKEELIRGLNKQNETLEEGWKETALAAAMGLSSLGAQAPAVQAAEPAPQAQTVADMRGKTHKNVPTKLVADKFIPHIGSDKWLPPDAWDKDSVKEEPMVAFGEIVSNVRTFWTQTLPNRYFGCDNNPETEECEILQQVALKVKSELDPVALAAQSREGKKTISSKLNKKIDNVLNNWVPKSNDPNQFQRTKVWTDLAGEDYVPGTSPTGPFVPTDDDTDL